MNCDWIVYFLYDEKNSIWLSRSEFKKIHELEFRE